VSLFQANTLDEPVIKPEEIFVGRDALLEIQAAGGPKRKLVGLEMTERGIGRDGYPVFSLDGKRLDVLELPKA